MTSSRYSRRAVLLGAAIAPVPATGCLGFDDDASGSAADREDDPAGSVDDETEDGRDGEGSEDESGGTESEADPDPEEPSLAVTEVATGLSHPWAIAILPPGGLLVTEREGRLVRIDPDSGDVDPIDGVPEVLPEGQGGLLDVELAPDFDEEPWIYLTYAAGTGDGESATHLGRGRFDAEAMAVEGFEELYVADAAGSSGHYGSRAVFGADGMLYVTVGDRQSKEFGPDHVAQDLGTDLGTTLRLRPDGSIPEDNPFVGGDEAVREAIYSYGHRNPQAMAVHPETGGIWQAEHGEEDGDEINRLEAGGNYGWPVATYACEYGTDDPVGDRPDEREGTVEPVHYWECGSGGFPPSGAAFYDGTALPWQGDLLVGNLAEGYLGRFSVEGAGTDDVSVREREPLLVDRGWRVRDVVVGDSSVVYVAVDAEDAPIVRLAPT
ncbi:PQQ-dependent sugar dehydrogenase [Saliphagus infecundisoli]|uniref:PQQ-dependent sugar dehydrogenase n=1 Tax=Saliphagus infecundisoli TaxID=1849069 RepID=A0ABD5QEN1_9EURY|nr:PQQ-dependent sugar dehydrogenase [Saliphagus infecundisoli]